MRSLHHFVAKSEWSDTAVMACVRDWVLPTLGLESGRYWIVDDAGFPKKGEAFGRRRPAVLRSAGQAGQLPGDDQPARWPAHRAAFPSPTGYQLYLPKDWAYPQITFLATAGRTQRHVPVAIATLRASSRK